MTKITSLKSRPTMNLRILSPMVVHSSVKEGFTIWWRNFVGLKNVSEIDMTMVIKMFENLKPKINQANINGLDSLL